MTQHWHVGSNQPGCLPDITENPGFSDHEDAINDLIATLEYERDLINDNDGDINLSEALDMAARETDETIPPSGIKFVLKDATGQDRAFWLTDCNDEECTFHED